jgi:hypothetical protein
MATGARGSSSNHRKGSNEGVFGRQPGVAIFVTMTISNNSLPPLKSVAMLDSLSDSDQAATLIVWR